jgi:Cu(I)/Ag(I) efflux system membrane fusion protein
MSPNQSETKFGRSFKNISVAIIVAIAFIGGYYFAAQRSHLPTEAVSPQSVSSTVRQEGEKPQLWTCAMHPQIKLPNPGKCPICFMDLIPLESHDHSDEDTGTQYSMSQAAKRLAEVETSLVKKERAFVKVRMAGQVYEDETRVAALTSRVDGRLDEIYINFTGVHVDKGDPMVTIWSPTLIKSQVELFETMRTGDEEESVIRGAVEKLIQYGLTREQVKEIREKKKPILNVTLRAPISGVVTRKMALLGQFVKEGTEMYIINDLSHVWIKMDAYETDLPWIRYGQKVTFTTPAVPGRTFDGRVLFIDPVLDTKTRSVKIRVEAENPDFTLKPGMFVTAEVEAEVDAKGRVIKREWAGKYVCPVHPRDEASPVPGICPESKMALRPASSFGYSDDPNPEMPLVVPASAALVTGKRAVVYIEVPGERPTYEGREVVLGPRADDKYVVYDGLSEGDRVVTKGNFKIDSAMQILARSSMMNPGEPKPASEKDGNEEVISKLAVPESFLRQLSPVIETYLSLKESLVQADSAQATKTATQLDEKLKAVNTGGIDKKASTTWKKLSRTIAAQAAMLSATQEIDKQRKAFDRLSETFAKMVMAFRHVMSGPLYLYNCPDAFDGAGAYWIEAKQEPRNPFFGDTQLKGRSMLGCGELAETIPPEFAPQAVKEDSAGGTPGAQHEQGGDK